MSQPEKQTTGAENVNWNLNDLFPSPSQLDPALDAAERRARSFEEAHRGGVAGMGPEALDETIRSFEAVQDRLDRAYTYAFLHWCTHTDDPGRGALFQKVRERYVRIQQILIFFEIELIHLPDDKLKPPAGSGPASYGHYLEMLALRRNHVLSEPEEKILAEKAITGAGAWVRFFDETLGAARFPVDGEELTEQEVLSRLYDPNRETRRSAALGFTDGLRTHSRTLTYIFNTMLAEKASEDRLRRYPHWLAGRNLSNEIADEAVEALIQAVTGRFDLVERYYRLKKRLLGVDELFDYDRYAPVVEADSRYSWRDARDLVVESYGAFSPRMAEIAGDFFRLGWIDAALRPGKRGGAFSHRAVPQVHPYILMNFTGNVRDVQTLAHELGHGVHQYLSRERGSLEGDTPLTTAETASVFGEMLVFDRLLQTETDPAARLALLVHKIDDTTATVFRQIAMNRFEDRIHRARREEGELPVERFGEIWIETQSRMFRGSVTLGEHYRIWWSYIPHFVHSPGYVYAYAFGELLVLALYSVYRTEPDGFAERYIKLLSAGGSDWPHVLLAGLGVDLRDPDFWNRGLSEIEALIAQAEELSSD
jgi:oligoendopeptidase F